MTTFLTRLAVAVLLVYFTAHALSGEQGIFRWISLQSEETRLRERIAALQAEEKTLHARLDRLRTGSLDIDFLDQLARSRLALVRPDEIILYDEGGAD